jgi:hypothetical protein
VSFSPLKVTTRLGLGFGLLLLLVLAVAGNAFVSAERTDALVADIAQLEKTVTSSGGKAALKAVVDARAAYMVPEAEFTRLAEAGDMKTAKTVLLDTARPLQAAYVDALGRFIDSQRALIDVGDKAVDALYASSRSAAPMPRRKSRA